MYGAKTDEPDDVPTAMPVNLPGEETIDGETDDLFGFATGIPTKCP